MQPNHKATESSSDSKRRTLCDTLLSSADVWYAKLAAVLRHHERVQCLGEVMMSRLHEHLCKVESVGVVSCKCEWDGSCQLLSLH